MPQSNFCLCLTKMHIASTAFDVRKPIATTEFAHLFSSHIGRWLVPSFLITSAGLFMGRFVGGFTEGDETRGLPIFAIKSINPSAISLAKSHNFNGLISCKRQSLL